MTAAVDQAASNPDQASDYTYDQAAMGIAYTPVGARVQVVTIPEAAHALGVSVETVRRRLRRKQLAGQKLPTAQGFEWRVLLPTQVIDTTEAAMGGQSATEAPTHAPGTPPSLQDQPAREVSLLEAHVTDLRTELAGARAELEARRREVQELHVIIARLTPAPAALPAPEVKVRDQATPTQPAAIDAYATSESTTRPNWWRRAWTLVTGA